MSENSCDRDKPFTTPPPLASSPEKFQQRLAALNQVTMALTRSSSIDELYHTAVKLVHDGVNRPIAQPHPNPPRHQGGNRHTILLVYLRRAVLGIRDLEFDRLGLFLVDPTDPYRLTGTYGTDRTGQVVAEQHVTFRLQTGDWLLTLVSGQTSAFHMVVDPVALLDTSADHKSEVVGTGWNAGAALWDGAEIVGYLLADNLLRQQRYTEFDGELLALYAGTIGHLCLRLRGEELLRNSHKMERNFRTRLAKLNDIAAQLMRVPDLDILYRSVIELGRHELDFDRLGLWLYAENRETLVGTYGTWLDGTLKDERHLTIAATRFESQLHTHADDTQGVIHHADITLTTPETNTTGHGWSATAVLSDGDKVIGYLSTDNLYVEIYYTPPQHKITFLLGYKMLFYGAA